MGRFFFVTIVCAAASTGASQPAAPFYTLSTIAGSAPREFIGDGGPAVTASLGAYSLARDTAGNLYVGDSSHARIRKIAPSGIITTVAGPGVPGFAALGSGAETPGAIQLGFTLGLAADPAGDLFISDLSHNRVIKLAASGAASIFAGTGAPASGGDGDPATAAALNQPFGLLVDRQGNVYIGESQGYRIRKVTPDGAISTFAGNGQAGSKGDGGPAAEAQVNVWGMAIDDAGVIYFADQYSGIRKISPGGVISKVAGTTNGFSGDGGPAIAAQLNGPTGIATDHAGNVYVADILNQRVRKIDAKGIITTIAGTGVTGSLLGGGRQATLSQLAFPITVLADDSGNVYAGEVYGAVRRIDAEGKIFSFAGVYPFGVSSGDGGKATDAQFSVLASVAADGAGNIFVSDSQARRIRKIDPTGIITAVAGDGEFGYLGDGVPASAAPLKSPAGIAADRDGNLYIADAGDQRVRKIGADGVIHTVAGSGIAGFAGDGGPATSAQLSAPSALAVDLAGNLYITDAGNNRVRKVTVGGVISTVAGGGAESTNEGDGGPATSASLLYPDGITVDAAGNLYIADSGHSRVRKVLASGIMSTIAGVGPGGTIVDGVPATHAVLRTPVSLAVDADGNLFISDESDNSVRRVRPDGIIDTVAGGVIGHAIDGAPGFASPLRMPVAVAADSSGNLYIIETGNGGGSFVRKATAVRGTGSPEIVGVVNAASLLLGSIAPGEAVSLFGMDLGPAAGVSGTADPSGRFGNQVAGVSVSFNGVPAPVIYAQSNQVNVIVPFEIPTEGAVEVRLNNHGKESTASVNLIEAAPEILTLSPSPRGGMAAAIDQDGSINSPENPALAGSVISVFVTGAGAMTPALVDGTLVKDAVATPVLPVSIAFPGGAGETLYAGAAPGLIAGVIQVNVRVPEHQFCGPQFGCVDPNVVPISVVSGGQHGSMGSMTIAVRY